MYTVRQTFFGDPLILDSFVNNKTLKIRPCMVLYKQLEIYMIKKPPPKIKDRYH